MNSWLFSLSTRSVTVNAVISYTHDKYSSIGFIFRMEMNLKRSSLKILCSQQRL